MSAVQQVISSLAGVLDSDVVGTPELCPTQRISAVLNAVSFDTGTEEDVLFARLIRNCALCQKCIAMAERGRFRCVNSEVFQVH